MVCWASGCGGSGPSTLAEVGGGSVGTCEEMAGSSGTLQCVGSVRGRVSGETGDPLGQVPVTVCGPVCFRGESDDGGRVEVEIGAWLDLDRYSIAAHGGPFGSTFYVPLSEPALAPSAAVSLLVLQLDRVGDMVVDKTQPNAGVAQTLSAGPVHIEVPAGRKVRLSPGDVLLGDEGRRFRVREVEPAFWGEFGLPSREGRLFALGPFEALFEGESEEFVGVRVDNDHDWAPGTPVSFLALGSYLQQDWLPAAEFAEMGRGHVDAGGSEIVMEPVVGDPGLQLLTWLWIVPSG